MTSKLIFYKFLVEVKTMELNPIQDILGFITPIISVIGVAFIVVRIFMKTLTKTTFEKKLTPRHEGIWEKFLESIFVSLFITLSLYTLSYFIAEKIDVINNHFLALTSLILFFLVICIYLIISTLLIAPNLKRRISQGGKIKKFTNLTIVTGYIGIIILNIVLMSYYMDGFIQDNTFIMSHITDILIYGIGNTLFFTFMLYVIQWTYKEFSIVNVDRNIYKVHKCHIENINNLFFINAIKQDVHILSETNNHIDSDFSPVYVHYVKEEILLKYELQKK